MKYVLESLAYFTAAFMASYGGVHGMRLARNRSRRR